MKFTISAEQLPLIFSDNWVTGTVENLPVTFNGVSTDSRSMVVGDLFLALRGDHFDGHQFLGDALHKGASAIIVAADYPVNSPAYIPHFFVKDTLLAYQQLAYWWRKQLAVSVIAVTGSVGKTTTKELISAILSQFGLVHKTQANYNNEIGVPRTLLGLERDHDYGVIELGMRARGEIAELTRIVAPDISLITNVGTAHIGRLGSEVAIANAKCELLAEMPQESIAIINHDNPLLLKTATETWQGQRLTYGLEGGDIRGFINPDGTITVDGWNLPLPLAGRHNALNYLAALAVAKALNLDWQSLTGGITVALPEGRSRRYDLPNDIVLLDETYNAGLESMKAALALLQETVGTRHIAVLGTMKELGDRSAIFHQQVGETVKTLGIDRLLVLVDDPAAEAIAKGAVDVPTDCFTTHEALIDHLHSTLQKGDRILFKASHSVGLDRVVKAMLASLQPPETSK